VGAVAEPIDVDPDEPTGTLEHLEGEADRPEKLRWRIRIFGSTTFFRLWLTQIVSATGDWLGLLAITALATRVGAGGNEGAAVGVVLAARLAPGLFLAPVAGVFADRWDRKKLMVMCDLGRALVLLSLPFVDTVGGLVLASLVLEVFTLLWAPAKEASVPHLVPVDHLTTANSLSLVAAYGTFPLAAGLFSLLSKAGENLGDVSALGFLRADQLGLAFYFDSLTFVVSAIMISTLPLPKRRREERDQAKERTRARIDFGQAFAELKEGWAFIFVTPTARAVNLGLATGLIGGGMLVPLGPIFATDVLGAGETGFGILIFAMGLGVAIGIFLLSILERRLPKDWVFTIAVFLAGVSLFFAASMSTLVMASLFVAGLGICAGAVYVIGFTLLHESVDDDMRGRIFGALNTLVRICVLLAFAVGPLLSEVLDSISGSVLDDQRLSFGGYSLFLPGERLALWFASIIIFGAGFIAAFSFRTGHAARRVTDAEPGVQIEAATPIGPTGPIESQTEPA